MRVLRKGVEFIIFMYLCKYLFRVSVIMFIEVKEVMGFR